MFPVLAGLFFGMIDGGRFISTRTMVSVAAAAGARAASLDAATQATVLTAAQNAATMLGAGLTVDNVQCTTSSSAACIGNWTNKTAGDTVVVTARYTFTASFFPAFTRTMSNTSRVIVE